MSLKWDVRFMRIAKEVSTWSKDPSTKVGTVVVNQEKRILATGYNGFPSKCNDDHRLQSKQTKYPLIIHSEINALLNALNSGVSVKDCDLYIYNLPPCGECSKFIAQARLRKILFCAPVRSKRWEDEWEQVSKKLFDECGIKHRELEERLIQ